MTARAGLPPRECEMRMPLTPGAPYDRCHRDTAIAGAKILTAHPDSSTLADRQSSLAHSLFQVRMSPPVRELHQHHALR